MNKYPIKYSSTKNSLMPHFKQTSKHLEQFNMQQKYGTLNKLHKNATLKAKLAA